MRTVAAAVVFLVAASVMAGCGGSDDLAAVETTTPIESQLPGPERAAAPQLAGASLEGDPISLDDFRGQPVLINVWSSW